jgi:tRNA (guanine-N7-)-methyltransferase
MDAVPFPVATPGSMPTLDAKGDNPKWTRLPIRTRPHRNPLADNDDEHPRCPAEMVSARLPEYYPAYHGAEQTGEADTRSNVEIADIGCAFGGMLCALAPRFPKTLMLGLEIRPKVVSFAQEKTLELRRNADPTKGHHDYQNLWFEQCNVMKYGSRFFRKGQLTRLFFCHPDPHWKRANIRRRIISPGLVHTYAYWLKVGGLLYTVSDVPELEQWMIDCLDASPLFERLTPEQIAQDRVVLDIAVSTSEDAQRAQRKGLPPNFAVHRRVEAATPASVCTA